MKDFSLFVFMILSSLLIGCTSDFSEDGDSTNNDLQALKKRIVEIGADYGFHEISIDENKLALHLNLTDAEIENFFENMQRMDGTYIATNDGQQYVFKKLSALQTRATGIRKSPEDVTEYYSVNYHESTPYDILYEAYFGHTYYNPKSCDADVRYINVKQYYYTSAYPYSPYLLYYPSHVKRFYCAACDSVNFDIHAEVFIEDPDAVGFGLTRYLSCRKDSNIVYCSVIDNY